MKTVSAVTGLSLLVAVSANRKVMEIINDNQDKLRAAGAFDKQFERDSVLGSPAECVDGVATISGEEFSCYEIDFLSFLSQKDLDIPEPEHRVGASSADIWGWLSPTGREFTLLALDNGVVAVDSTDPENPCIVAKMPTRRVVDKWGDVKVYENTMYHVKDTGVQDNDEDAPEGNAEYGIEVYDLLQFDQLDCTVEGYNPIFLFPQFLFTGHGRSHNVAINPESGLLYSTGSEKCSGGLVILDAKVNPPVQVGCASQDGYTHDVQCLTYDGPDPDHQGKEVCFAYNEDTLTIWDITDPALPLIISRTLYPNQVYSHQGWVNDDLTKVLLDDELDELCNERITSHPRCDDFSTTELSGELRTTTNVFNIVDLDRPFFEGAYIHPEQAVDHNLYVWGTVHRKGWGGNPPLENHPNVNYAYMANYIAGLKVVDISSSNFEDWRQVGYFDIAPDLEGTSFAGAWSTYMHPSGVTAVSSIERGLFFLKPKMAFTEPADLPPLPVSGSGNEDDNSADKNAGLITLAVLMVILLVGMLVFTAYKQRQNDIEARTAAATQAREQSQAGSALEAKQLPMGSTINPAFQEDAAEP